MRYFRYKVILILVIFKMKKIWLLTTLLVSGLLLTGCNNHQYEEEYSEYWLLQWPNGTITAEDFIKAWTRIDNKDLDNWVTLVNERKICNTPETACVPVILNDDNILITPHEHNTTIEEFKDENVYLTDLETFRKVTWLKEASPEYTQNLDGQYFFDAYTKFYQTIEEKEAMVKEKLENQIIEEPVIEEQKQNTLTEKDYQAKPLDDWWDWSETNDDFWYTTYAKVVQSWNFNNYINNEYGFEFNLPESWNDWILVHFLTISNSNEIISDNFHLVYPRKGLEWQKVKPVFPTWWDTLILMNVVWLDTTSEELNAQLLSDDNAIENNKYKFLFSIQDAPVNVFDWKVSKSDLECWKNPNCHCQHKEEYMNWGIWDEMPNPHADLWCYLVTILKNHMKLFNI